MGAAPRFAFPLFLLGSAVLSAGPLLVRLADVGPTQSAFWRLAIGAPLLFLLVRAVEGRQARLASVPHAGWLTLAGLFFAADLAAWHFGIARTTLANSTLLANSTAFLFPVWGYLVIRKWPTRQAGVALVLAAAGIAILAGRSASLSPAHLSGDLLCLLAAVFYTGYLVVMQRTRRGTTALGALAWATLAGAAILLPVALIAPGAFWPRDWTPLVILALSSQLLGQGLIIYALPHLPPIASGLGLLIQPIFSASFGYGWYGEILAPSDLAGMAIIFIAILLVRSRGATAKRVETRTPPLLGGAQAPD
ncbi:MAG: DMT family transporter [Parasphingopyxis sp.]